MRHAIVLMVLVLVPCCDRAGCGTEPSGAPRPSGRSSSLTSAERYHQEEKGPNWDVVFEEDGGFNTQPNQLLVSAIAGRPAGVALDVGMGQGRNALYLARHGWKVTGVDTSSAGMRLANVAAERAAVAMNLHTVYSDINEFDFGHERYDLIALIYVGGASLTQRISEGLKPGGLVVVEYFHTDEERRLGRRLGAFASGELATLYAGFTVISSEEVRAMPDFGTEPTTLVRFVAQKPAAATR